MLRANYHFLLLLLACLFLSACRPVQAPAAQPAPAATSVPVPSPTAAPAAAASNEMELKAEKIVSQALAGNLLGDPAERRMYVLLPPGYATSEKRYPVVYVMPWGRGYPGDNTLGFKDAMESLLRKGEIQEMIVVVPDGTNSLSGGLFLSSPTLGDYEAYVTREVVNYVDTHYRTLPTRDSRGIGGCSNGGTSSMRLALKYPNIFSVVAATDGGGVYSPDVLPTDVEEVRSLKELPTDIRDSGAAIGWWVQLAAGAAPDPNNPPFYAEMPVRIIDGQGEFVPEVVAKIEELDAAHEARRYVLQPVRLRGIRLQHGTYDAMWTPSIHSFEQVLNDLGIEHEYVEVETGHCGYGWEQASLKYLSDKLSFAE